MKRKVKNFDSTLGSRLKQLNRDLREMSSGTRYVTKKETLQTHARIIDILQECTDDVEQYLDIEARRVLPELRALISPEKMESKRIRVNNLLGFGPGIDPLAISERTSEKTLKIAQELSPRLNQLERDKHQLLSGKRCVEDLGFGPGIDPLAISERTSEKTPKIAQELSPRLNQLERDKHQLLSGKRCVEDVDALTFHERLEAVLTECTQPVRGRLDIQAESSWLYRLLHPGRRWIFLTTDALRITGPFNAIATDIPIDFIDDVTPRRSCLWAELRICLADGTRQSFGGLTEPKAGRVRDAILREAEKLAGDWDKRLNALAALLSSTQYIRYSDSREIHKNLLDLTRQRGRLVRDHLGQRASDTLDRLDLLKSSEAFEKERKRLNEIYVRDSVHSVKAIAGTDLTVEQAKAIATDEDVTLVLAGAGTGKTKVIVGRVAHLVHNQGVDPSEILVLAFNNKAAEEIRERLPGKLSGASVFTFNAFGNKVIGECEGKKPTVSELAKDDKKLRDVVDDILNALLFDRQQSRVVINFIVNHRNPRHSAFDFKTVAEYRQYVNSIELRTLNGDIVKSQEELEIANFLTISGIDFVYEQPYKVDTANRQYRQYSPDFFLPEYDIYIEHFALSEEGQPPPGWDEYAKGVDWKRGIHRQNNTMLIQTYSWQFRQGILLKTLRAKLEEIGVDFNPIPIEELAERLGDARISWLSKLLTTFLNHVRGGNIKSAELRDRAGTLKGRDRRRDVAFLDVFEQVRVCYEQLLEDAREIDFHHQINVGASYLSERAGKSPYQYVLVDEFQDISKGRMRLLQSLNHPNVAFFLVGDDWQSIYRFTGSDFGLIDNCGDYLGYVQEQTLTQTFRFSKGILDPSTTFIKRNPDQTQRNLRSASNAEDKGITIVAANNPDKGLRKALQDIEAKAKSKYHSVLVLGRYKSTGNLLPKDRRDFKSLQLEYSTVHAAKGREADYVIVLDLKDNDRWGFPCKIEDDPLLDIVLPPASDDSLPFAEERRLFYVAMTRARIGAFLVTDVTQPSAFVEELQTYSSIKKVGKIAERCPECHVGFLKEIPGSRGPFMGCTEYWAEPSCGYTKNIEAKRDDKLEADSEDQFWDKLLDPRSR